MTISLPIDDRCWWHRLLPVLHLTARASTPIPLAEGLDDVAMLCELARGEGGGERWRGIGDEVEVPVIVDAASELTLSFRRSSSISCRRRSLRSRSA